MYYIIVCIHVHVIIIRCILNIKRIKFELLRNMRHMCHMYMVCVYTISCVHLKVGRPSASD